MVEKLKKLTDKAQGEVKEREKRDGSAPKRPRKDQPCEIGTGSSSASTAPAALTMDGSVDDSSKRAAPAGESDERRVMSRITWKFLMWSAAGRFCLERQRGLGHVRRDVRGCAASRHQHEFLR